jgi:hypothetical protein
MALYYGKHNVRDYDEWRPYFDGDQERIHAAGATCLNVMRSADNPNDVHFLFNVPDLQKFLSVLQSPETAGIMQQAGVMEQPIIYRLEELGGQI